MAKSKKYQINGMDVKVWEKFKTKWASKGKTMREVMIQLIKEYVK